jgi:hypothetical protein
MWVSIVRGVGVLTVKDYRIWLVLCLYDYSSYLVEGRAYEIESVLESGRSSGRRRLIAIMVHT